MMRKFGGRMADMAGRAMRNPSKDMMGRAMARAGQSPVGVAPPVRANRPVEPDMSYKKGGNVKESKAMAKKEIAFMKKKGAPKSMIKHEKAEAKGMKAGGMTKMGAVKTAAPSRDGVASKGKTKGKMIKMAKGGCY
jgi:hypothetical protein